MKYSFTILFFACVLLLAGCDTTVTVSADKKNGASFICSAAMGTAIEQTVRTVSGAQGSSPLFNGSEIKKQMEAAGFQNVSASDPSPSSLSLKGYISRLADGLPAVPGAFTYSETPDGRHKLVFVLSARILKQAAALLPEKERSYTDLLMAPVFTGETMSKDEYLDLVSSVYGQSITEELKNSRLVIVMEAPVAGSKPLKSVIQLVDLFTLSGNTEISNTLAW
jgi:hypothetical protein